MVRSAAAAGVDFVKFQTYRAETIATPGATFTFDDGRVVSQFDFFKAHELSRQDHDALDACCRSTGIGWFSTPSHVSDVELLEAYDPPAYKTGSDDLTNLPFLCELARTGRPMIVSTGMCTLGEIEKAVEAIAGTGNERLVLLHCVVSYPSRIEDANLKMIETLKRAFGKPVGLSDHTGDEFTSVLATAMGICMIEKHFTLDHDLSQPDHEAALDPKQFARLVEQVRLVPKALGTGVKTIQETEVKWRKAARKSIFANRAIPAGAVISVDDLVIRRPSDGLHPHFVDVVVGAKARRDIPAGSLLSLDMIDV
jgi:sialic acid synthase SpsE